MFAFIAENLSTVLISLALLVLAALATAKLIRDRRSGGSGCGCGCSGCSLSDAGCCGNNDYRGSNSNAPKKTR